MVLETELNQLVRDARIKALKDALDVSVHREDVYSSSGGNFDDAYDLGIQDTKSAILALLKEAETRV